jgi:hypothetical protein
VVPLSELFVVDPAAPAVGTTGAFSSATAFKTFTAAMTAALAASSSVVGILVQPGDYSGEADVAFTGKTIIVESLGLQEPNSFETLLPKLIPTRSGAEQLMLRNVSATVAPTNNIKVVTENCKIDATGIGNFDLVCQGSPETAATTNSTGAGALGSLTIFGVRLGACSVAGALVARGCSIEGDLSAATATVTTSTFNTHNITLTGAGFVTDLSTVSTIGTRTGGTLTVLDDPSPTHEVWVQTSSTAPTTCRTGSKNLPFAAVQDAINFFPAGGAGAPSYGIVRVMDLTTSEDLSIDTYRYISVVWEGEVSPSTMAGFAHFDQVSVSNHAELTLQGFWCEHISMDTARFYGVNVNIGSCGDAGGSNVKLVTTFPHAPGDGSEHYSCGNIDVAGLQAYGVTFDANVRVSASDGRECLFQQCELRLGTLTIANAAMALNIDTWTLGTMRRNGVALSAAGAVHIVDAPLTTGVTFAVPALAAATGDVTVALTGARPADTFSLAMTTRLAGVGIVGAWCAANDNITVRFFGTTGGGNVVCNVNVIPNQGS